MHSWSWRCSTLKMALIRSKLDYAAPTWQPRLSATNLSCLNCLQNGSLWLISGQLVSTPLEAFQLEVKILKASEKALRSTDDHPKRVAVAADIPQIFQNRSSFRRKAEELSTLLPSQLQHRQNIIHFPSPPWQHRSSQETRIDTTVLGISDQADDTNLKHQYSRTTIASYQADYTICTNGSASRRTRNRGAAAVVTRGSPLQPEVVTTIKTRGKMFSSSYEEEAAAMKSALSWTSTNVNHLSISLLFCPDSKFLFEALISSNPWTFSIHNSINSISFSNFFQWIPGHPAIPGNDLADKAAKEVPTIATDTIHPVSVLVPFRLLTKQFAMLYQHKNAFL